MTETLTDLDFDARYTVAGYRGIAFYLKRWETEVNVKYDLWCEEGEPHEHTDACYDTFEEEDPTGMVIAVMVGDDREHVIDPDDLTVLDDLAYCDSCGQVGCAHDGRDRDE